MKRSRQSSAALLFVTLLALSGGLMDAYSYICREHVFANAQTGNMLLFGINLATGNFSSALQYLVPVLAFTLGIAAAEIIRNSYGSSKRLHWRQVVLLAEAVILLAVAFIPRDLNLLANSLTSFACGVQVESFQKIKERGITIATTMCIGNLRSATQAICDYGFTKNKKALGNGFLYLGIIGMFIIGAVIGNFFVSVFGEKAIIASVVLLLTCFLSMFINKEL